MTSLYILLVFVFFTGVTRGSGQCSSTTASSTNNLPGSCTFENGTCGYGIRSPWNLTTSYKKGKWYTPVLARDDGHFVVMDRHSSFIDSFGIFESPLIPAGDYCLTFWYYITYSAVRLIGNTTTGNTFCNLTEISLDTVSWKNVTVELHEATPFQISFTSIHIKYDQYTYMDTSIVDDIVLGQMPSTTTTTAATTTEEATTTTVTTTSTATTEGTTTSTAAGTTTAKAGTTKAATLPTESTAAPTTEGRTTVTTASKPTVGTTTTAATTPPAVTTEKTTTAATTKAETTTEGATTVTTSSKVTTAKAATTTGKAGTTTAVATTAAATTTTTAATTMVSAKQDCMDMSILGSCPFSSVSGTCGYTLDSGWKLQHGPLLLSGRPLHFFDNNPQNDSYYIAYQSYTTTATRDIQSPCLPSGSYCLDMWYVMPSGSTQVEVLIGDRVIYTLSKIRQWTNVSLNFTSADDFKLILRIGLSTHTSLFGVDDIRLYYNKPTTTSRIPNCLSPTESTTTNKPTQGALRLEDAIHHGCTSNGWNVTINMDIMKQLYPNITTNQIYFGDNSCRGKETGSYLVFQQGFRDCLTSERISGDTFLYENDLYSAIYDPIHPYIMRQRTWSYTVECDVTRSSVTSSHVQHNTSSHHATETAQYDINLSFYKDSNFMNQLSGNPVHVNVGDDVFVKAYTTVADWSTKMRLHSCYTESGNSADKNSTYYLIKDGCEVDSNTHLISQSTHETKFVFQDFVYASSTEGLTVHCNATFCKSNDYSTDCLQTCNPSVVQTFVG